MSKIVSIVHTPRNSDPHPPDHYARVPLESAVLAVGHGIEGCRKGTSRKRQLNVMAAETLQRLAAEGFKTAPGEMGEQIVISGIDVDRLTRGARLQLGERAVIEIISQRIPCERFEHIQGKTIAEAMGRIGMMVNVVAGGEIKVGDAVLLLHASVVA